MYLKSPLTFDIADFSFSDEEKLLWKIAQTESTPEFRYPLELLWNRTNSDQVKEPVPRKSKVNSSGFSGCSIYGLVGPYKVDGMLNSPL